MTGENLDLNDDLAILSINSPKGEVKGPYVVVYRNIETRWVIVALKWGGDPSLGIRWFWDPNGHPTSRNYPTWFIIPSELRTALLNGLPLEYNFKRSIERFLSGEIEGENLKSEYSK